MKKLKNLTACFISLCFALSMILIISVTSAEEMPSYDYSKILNGDLSDFVGVWKNAEGNYIYLKADGTQGDDGVLEDGTIYNDIAVDFKLQENGFYCWSVQYVFERGGGESYAIYLYPIGVEVVVNDKIIKTDISKVRLYAGQDFLPAETMSDSIYYLQPLFSDVPEDHWAFEYIKAFADIGVLAGYEDGTFRPDAPVTRAEWSKMLVTAFGLPIDEHWGMMLDLGSNDVFDLSEWYAPYVYAAEPYFNAERIEMSDGEPPMLLYKPEDGATREDVAVSVAKLIESAGYPIADNFTLPFDDVDTISIEGQKYIAMTVNNGIIAGFEDNTFRGQNTLTRAEAATILYKTIYN